MHDLLTAREVIDLLKIDRTTLYRMLKNGRLTGVKIGNQWRFYRQKVEAFIAGDTPVVRHKDAYLPEKLPFYCIQPLQEVFADIARAGVVTTEPDGTPITEISNSCHFCNLVLSTESGRKSCIRAWKKLAVQKNDQPQFVSCHAGLQYARAEIRPNGKAVAMLIAGQFYTSKPDPQEQKKRIKEIAAKHGLNEKTLLKAAKKIPVLDERWRNQIANWLSEIARALGNVVRERGELMTRLKKITELSNIPSHTSAGSR